MPKTYAIGDVHGSNEQLNILLSGLNIQFDDTLIFLGDVIDKSMNNKKIVITSKL